MSEKMTREDVVRIAREADPGFEGGADSDGTMTDSIVGIDQVLKFAHLVAAVEREACAEIAASTVCDEHIPTGIKIYGTRAAKAIRARGEK